VDCRWTETDREVGMAGGSREPGRTVTARVLSILAIFEDSLAPRSLTDITAATGIPTSTAHRLLGELEAWGAVQRDGLGRYQIGMRLWELGQHAGRHGREIARPHLQDLFSLTQETVHIAVRDGMDVLYVDRIYGSRRVPQASRVGGRLPLHATAVGKAILAFEDEAVRDAVLREPLERRTSATHVDPSRLSEELATIRRIGHALAVEEVRAGSASIAVPLFERDGRVGAALGLVVATADAPRLDRHLPALLGIARKIEARMGNVPLASLRSSRTSRGGDPVAPRPN
jgi:DNA-binding IclR family transcriptional regulator